jgi:ubiquitin carboxyl-terminal hydrolase 12/46
MGGTNSKAPSSLSDGVRNVSFDEKTTENDLSDPSDDDEERRHHSNDSSPRSRKPTQTTTRGSGGSNTHTSGTHASSSSKGSGSDQRRKDDGGSNTECPANKNNNNNKKNNLKMSNNEDIASGKTNKTGDKNKGASGGVGLENFGNTCYCNSVLQALYHCQPFKKMLLEYHATQTDSDANLLLSLGGLFAEMSKKEQKALTSSAKRVPVVEPKKFVSRLKKSNECFNSYEHQDAHEFLNYLLNECCEILERERDEVKDNYDSKRNSRRSGSSAGSVTPRISSGSGRLSVDEGSEGNDVDLRNVGEESKSAANKNGSGKDAANASAALTLSNAGSNTNIGGISDALNMRKKASSISKKKEKQTWVHEVFQGETVNETRCLWCENVTSRSESFLEISVEVKPNSSIQQCLSDFSASELLGGEDKFQCDSCSGLHEAHKRLLIRTAPSVLALHLKRFKYVESVGRMQKLNHRVAFSRELKLPNLSVDSTSSDDLYCLFAVVVHIGSGPNHGHYVCFARTSGYKASGGGASERWVMFDDETVQDMNTEDLESVFGSKGVISGGGQGGDADAGGSEHGYILFYQKVAPDGEDEEETFLEEEAFLA